MGYIGVEVQNESRAVGVEAQIVPEVEMERIRDAVYDKYSTGIRTSHKPLWELLENYESFMILTDGDCLVT
jgi:hypothetical protein